MTNQKIRDAAKKHGVKLWEVGDVLGLNDGNFSRKLRHELPTEEQENIIKIIRSIAEERSNAE